MSDEYKSIKEFLKEEGRKYRREQWFAVYGFLKALYVHGHISLDEFSELGKLTGLDDDDKDSVTI